MPGDLVQSVDRALQILMAFDAETQEMSVLELSRRVGLSKSTVHRLLSTLSARNFIEQNPLDGKYRLGLTLYELGTATIMARSFVAEAEPVLKAIVARYGETTSLSVLEDTHMVIIDKLESSAALRLTSQIGRQSALHTSASGKALLAYLPEDFRDRLIARLDLTPFTARTITDPGEFRRHLEVVRERGYAVDDEEVSEDLVCIGAPIFDHTGRAVAAISLSGPAGRVRQKGVAAIGEALAAAGRDVSQRLGYSVREEAVPG